MKRIAILLAAIVVLAACDRIDKPYKVEYPKALISVDTPQFEVIDHALQKILIEEYTGHRCVNCPKGHKAVSNLKNAMGDTLVIVALHVGENFAGPEPENTHCPSGFRNDYRTQAGNKYEKDFSIGPLPVAVFNRSLIDNKYGQPSVDAWENIANAIPRTQAKQGLQIQTIWNDTADTLFVFVNATLFADMAVPMRLTVLLLENNIVSPQLNSSLQLGSVPAICDYSHQHMLRTNISPMEGSAFTCTTIGENAVFAYALPWKKAWKKTESHIVAFLSDAISQEVLQAEEVDIIE